MSTPIISVVMPAYNHEIYVAEAVQSVLDQTFTDFELVIIDDGSTDNTAEVINNFSDPRIKYHFQENQDAYNALNNGMAKAEGDFISIINSDDVYADTRLEKMIEQHQQTQAQCLFSDVLLIDDKSNPITDDQFWWIQWHQGNRDYFLKYKDLYAAFLHANIMVTTSNLFMTRQAYEKVGNFEPLRYLHDYDYIFRLLNALGKDVHYLDADKLMSYRLHGSNTLSEAAVVGREQDIMIIRKNLLLKFPDSQHDYLNIGIDRLIQLEHELVEAKAQFAAARHSQQTENIIPEHKPGLLNRIVAKLKS